MNPRDGRQGPRPAAAALLRSHDRARRASAAFQSSGAASSFDGVAVAAGSIDGSTIS